MKYSYKLLYSLCTLFYNNLFAILVLSFVLIHSSIRAYVHGYPPTHSPFCGLSHLQKGPCSVFRSRTKLAKASAII